MTKHNLSVVYSELDSLFSICHYQPSVVCLVILLLAVQDASFHSSTNPDRIFYPKRFRIGNSIRQGFFRKPRRIGFFIRNGFG